MNLARFPRIRFAHLPTPLEHLPNLSRALNGPEIWIKRDDCTGMSTGGNKTRKLEFLLAEAREQADDIMARARKSAETAEAEATVAGKEKREELVNAAKRDIEAETRRSLEQIRKEVADLTVLATEKVTRKSLDGDDQRRLVEEALGEVDFSSLSGSDN